MLGQGLTSLFPMAEIAVMGILPVIARLPSLLSRIRQTAQAAITARPDALVIIDSPDFTHRVARRVRAAAPTIPIVDYVSPTVWAWRPGRARAMRGYVDHLLALLPFEPEAHRRLGGPPCSYVGHPLVATLARAPDHQQTDRPLVLILPGSRHSEIRRLMPPFGEAVARIAAARPDLQFVLPAVAHVRHAIDEALASWPVKPELIAGEEEKLAAFRAARAALAASGTVTLELALEGVPTVAAYRGSPLEKFLFDRLVDLPSVLLPNLIAGRNIMPELLQQSCTGPALAEALLPLIDDGPMREAQIAGFADVRRALEVPGNDPSLQAARIVLSVADEGCPKA